MNRTALIAALCLGALAATALPARPTAQAPVFTPRSDDRPFSVSVRTGKTIYLSGQIGFAADGKGVVPGGIEAETRRTMELIGADLARQGLGYDNLVKCTVMLADMKDWPAFNAIYAGYFKPGRYPARSALGANGLALGARVEVECIAWAARTRSDHLDREDPGPDRQGQRAAAERPADRLAEQTGLNVDRMDEGGEDPQARSGVAFDPLAVEFFAQ